MHQITLHGSYKYNFIVALNQPVFVGHQVALQNVISLYASYIGISCHFKLIFHIITFKLLIITVIKSIHDNQVSLVPRHILL